MRRELRLAVLLLLTAVPWMWWFGDYNLYLGQGHDLEFKALPTPVERLVGSLCLGSVFSLVVTFLFWMMEQAARPWTGSVIPPTEDEKAEPPGADDPARNIGI